MSGRQTLVIATLGSVLLLSAAFLFQHVGGMAPCKMCIWQRYPHAAAIAAGVLALAFRHRLMLLVGAVAALTTSAVGMYHAGVEQGWWEGPSTCTSGPVADLSPDDLMAQIMAAPLVRCDEIPWQLVGLSMAGWNALLSMGLVLLWVTAWRRH